MISAEMFAKIRHQNSDMFALAVMLHEHGWSATDPTEIYCEAGRVRINILNGEFRLTMPDLGNPARTTVVAMRSWTVGQGAKLAQAMALLVSVLPSAPAPQRHLKAV